MQALVKYLDNITDEDIIKLNIPTDIPLVFEPDNKLKTLISYYLGKPEEAKKH